MKKISTVHDFIRKDGLKGNLGSLQLSDPIGTNLIILGDEKTIFLVVIILS